MCVRACVCVGVCVRTCAGACQHVLVRESVSALERGREREMCEGESGRDFIKSLSNSTTPYIHTHESDFFS